ncbi:MBL fold metallo-hydrolase [Halalkalirubrum salinum]|uniref:MBL fold metallo-hydrolase n=1 Tax=Halalkalirubrum salinum TaxID=2563889 RepID=UPI0010FBAB76|nr:MBL fold metallo-hydrolase [Halalkalirubrum salinum]
MTVRYGPLSIEWLGYATARIETEDGTVVYTDPGRYGVLDGQYPKDADLVVVTHNHHYDSDAIGQVADSDATIVVYEGVDAAEIDRDVTPVSELPFDVIRVTDDDHVAVETAVETIDVWSVPAYNEPDGPCADADGTVVHPKGLGCGYLIAVGGERVFWPGDSDALDGFAELDVSVFLANIGGTVVSDAEASADLADRMRPELVVPIHYNTLEMLEADSKAFAADVASRSIAVALDERGVDR